MSGPPNRALQLTDSACHVRCLCTGRAKLAPQLSGNIVGRALAPCGREGGGVWLRWWSSITRRE